MDHLTLIYIATGLVVLAFILDRVSVCNTRPSTSPPISWAPSPAERLLVGMFEGDRFSFEAHVARVTKVGSSLNQQYLTKRMSVAAAEYQISGLRASLSRCDPTALGDDAPYPIRKMTRDLETLSRTLSADQAEIDRLDKRIASTTYALNVMAAFRPRFGW